LNPNRNENCDNRSNRCCHNDGPSIDVHNRPQVPSHISLLDLIATDSCAARTPRGPAVAHPR
jgi:hypothetical protein